MVTSITFDTTSHSKRSVRQLQDALDTNTHQHDETQTLPLTEHSQQYIIQYVSKISNLSQHLPEAMEVICVASLQKGPHVAIYQSRENRS